MSPELSVADCDFNAREIIRSINEAQGLGIKILVFPELCVTGYTCGDLFLQKALLKSAESALRLIAEKTKDTDVLAAVGLPLSVDETLYNCAAWIHRGKILCAVPKTFVPNYNEFYELRHFSPYTSMKSSVISLGKDFESVLFGTSVILQDKNSPFIKIAAEICEDAWAPLSPGTRHCLAGATVIANLSASNEVVGKAEYRRSLVTSLSAKNLCAYIYSDAGHSESTTDLVFSAHNIIACDGAVQAQSRLFSDCGSILFCDIDMERLEQERIRTKTFSACASLQPDAGDFYETVEIDLGENTFCQSSKSASIGFTSENKDGPAPCASADGLRMHVPQRPFVPDSREKLSERSHAVIEMQAEGLSRRLRHTKAETAVIGLSGGLDSTLALLVTARAFDKCGIERRNISAVTMPCFGTTDRTYENACSLARSVGATLTRINITKAVRQHFEDIGHDESDHGVTYENAQARQRTLILMDMANKTGGMVIGTGDLSELALGWCTYNGDQMSMYGVNSSIPKTLVRHLVEWFSEEGLREGDKELGAVLKDILATPVSPELLPPQDGGISQRTEEIVGPYELHDFFLYYVLRWGFEPRKIYFLARHAFTPGQYSDETIKKWLVTFYRRFFSQQFKRSCMPDGAKVGTVSLSPRGDWRMPSDASARLWLKQAEEL